MLGFLSELSELTKAFVLVLSISLVAILISLWTGGLAATVVVSGTIISILTITKGVWDTDYGYKTSVRLASLGIIYLLAVSQPEWKTYVNPLLEPIANIVGFSVLLDKLPEDTPSISTLVVVVIGICLINYWIRDTTAMKEHPVPLEKEFPEKPYKQRLKSFCGVLLDDINRLDRETNWRTNWSVEYYTPLDAEVEVRSRNKRLRKITDLLTAIRSDRTSQVFLVIGDPGSGKSVALRKLCRDLLKESEKTGKVPLYINLREWQPKQKWTEENPPTVEELYDFVIYNLKSRGDIFINDFIDLYFKKMFDHGRLFFILDSFDEMPGVLDVNEGSWLIDKLSDVIYRFLAGTNESRGVLVSRIFRRPTSNFDAKTILEIRPFTERKIIESFEKSLKSNEPLIQRLFKERPDLVPIARNPFTAALISDYVKDYNDLPANQAELYSSYINKRFDSYSCQEKLEEKKLTKEQVIQGAIDIADVMFTTENVGIEAPINDLKEKLQLRNYSYYEVEKIIDILKYAKLGRVGSGRENRFSFVHRRFNEYFVVQQLIKHLDRVPKDAIPTDSRWRDALVLYCEVIEEIEAKKIANFCWSEIEPVVEGHINMDDPRFLRMLYCLRFLKEAFISRRECLDDFRDKLTIFVEYSVVLPHNLLLKKFAVEAVGLLKDEDVDRIIVEALNLDNSWISETAINSCRHLPEISDDLKNNIMAYLEIFDIYTLYRMRKDLLFSFKLSNGFDAIANFLRWRIVDIYCFTIGAILIFILSPLITFLMIFVVWFLRIIFNMLSWRIFSDNKRRLYTHIYLYILSLIIFYYFYFINDYTFLDVLVNYLSLDNYFVLDNSSDLYQYPIYLPIIFFVDKLFVLRDNVFFFIFFFIFVLILPIYQGLFFIVFPVIKSFNQFSVWKKDFSSIKKNGCFYFILFFIIISGPVFLGLLFYFYVKILPFLLDFILLNKGIFELLYKVILIMFFMYIISLFYLKLIPNIKDQLKLKKILKLNINSISRERIANELRTYKTAGGRLKYIEYLQNQKIKPNGEWTSEGLPNFNDDEASILLAKLEEKWLF